MKARATVLARLRAAWVARRHAWSAKLDTVTTRDRYALWAAAAALAVGAELAVVEPLHQKAARIEQAARAQLEEALAQAEVIRRERDEQQKALNERLATARRTIERHGVAHSGSVTAADALQALFADRRVRVLRVASDVTPLEMPANGAADAQPADGAQAATAPLKLYVHRLDVELAGSPSVVLQAAQSLARGSLPWRMQSIRWRRGAPGEAIAVCSLAVESTEATWLRL